MKNKYSDTDLRKKIEKGISEMEKVLDTEDATPNQKAYASQTLSSLIQRYRELFGTDEEEPKMKRVSGWKGE